MTFEELELLLKQKGKINISELAKLLDVSRQTIHSWKQKNSVPKKYNNLIAHLNFQQKHFNVIEVEIEIEINYNKEFLLIGNSINIKENKIELSGTNKYNEHIIKEYTNDKYKIINQESIENGYYSIKRYETTIDYKNKIIRYRLFCMTTGTGLSNYKYMINNRILSRISSLTKEKLYNNIFDNYNFKDIVNYIKYNERDIIIDLGKEKFYEIYKLVDYIYIEKNIIEPMGIYIKVDKELYEKINNLLEDNLSEYKKINFNYLNCIFICSEIINNNINYLYNDAETFNKISNMTKGINTSNQIDYIDLYKIVLAHEYGHLIFSYNESNNKLLEERKANYMVSNIYNNKYDLFNKYLTTYQPYIYSDILIKPETKMMYEKIDTSITSYLDLNEYNKYYEEVEKLYE